MERGMQVVLIAMLFALVCQSVGAASFSAGNVVEVLNAGSIGLKVRDAPCLSGSWDGVTRKFDGARGSVLQSSTSCDGYIWWKIRWSDGREGWTADGTATEQWLRSVSISPSTKFSLNNQVQVTDTGVHVRGSIPDLASIGSVSTGMQGTVIGGPFYGIPKSSSGFYYFWNVNFGSISGWVAEDYLTRVTLSAPSAPQNLVATPGDARVTLSWSAPSSNGGSAITGYRIYRAPVIGPIAYLTTVSGTSTSYTNTGLTNGNLYRYAVSAVNSINEGPISAEASATPQAIVSVPAIPVSISPGSSAEPGPEVSTLNPTLSWNGVSGATRYEVYLSRSPYGSSNIVFSNTNVGGTSVTVTPALLEGTNYRWDVSACNAAGCSNPSSNLYFHTFVPVQIPGVPTTLSPGTSSEPGQELSTTTPAFSWNGVSGAERYELAISKSPYGSANIIYANNNLGGTSFTIPSGNLQEGINYRWDLVACNSAGCSNPSADKYFHIAPTVTIPAVPSPISPGTSSAPGELITTLTPTLQWGGVSGAARYQVYVSKSPYGASNIVFQNENVQGTSVVATGLLAGTQYRWDVSACNSAGCSLPSANKYFQTQSVGPVCGNSIVETGEQCDDGNTINGDGCSSTCQIESSGTVDYPGATWIPAHQNGWQSASRGAAEINYVVIHATDSSAASAISWFQDPSSGVSAHYLVKQNGEVIQLVRDKDYAWHAGNYQYNLQSIGIEHEGLVSDPNAYTEAQYAASAALVQWLIQQYSIPTTHIIGIGPANPSSSAGILGHDQVPDPNNPALGGGASHHTDPGQYWNWNGYMTRLGAGPVCGNGAVESGEQCDDGNVANGDGCSASCQTETPTAAFFDDFESGFGKWTESNELDWNIESTTESGVPGHGTGNRVAHADNCDTLCTITSSTVNIAGSGTATLSFWRFVDNDLDSGEYLKVEIFDGSTWRQIASWTNGAGDDNVWHQESYSVTSYANANFRVRFVTKESSTAEEVEIDDIRIEAGGVSGPVCGNSIVESGEFCDGNSQSCTVNGYAGTQSCNVQCSAFNSCQTTQYCGDGTVNGPEQCDDGNAVSGDGCSSICQTEVQATAPSAPRSLTATPGDGSVSLSWTIPSSNGGSAITNYKIYRGTSPGGETLHTTTPTAGTTFQNTAVTNGVTYYYKVTAVNAIGESLASNEASATPTPPTQSSVTPELLAAIRATLEKEVGGSYLPVEEYGDYGMGSGCTYKIKGKCRSTPYDGGVDYKGRGYIQITHKYNYLAYCGPDCIGTSTPALNVCGCKNVAQCTITDAAVCPMVKALQPTRAGGIFMAFYRGKTDSSGNNLVMLSNAKSYYTVGLLINGGSTYASDFQKKADSYLGLFQNYPTKTSALIGCLQGTGSSCGPNVFPELFIYSATINQNLYDALVNIGKVA